MTTEELLDLCDQRLKVETDSNNLQETSDYLKSLGLNDVEEAVNWTHNFVHELMDLAEMMEKTLHIELSECQVTTHAVICGMILGYELRKIQSEPSFLHERSS